MSIVNEALRNEETRVGGKRTRKIMKLLASRDTAVWVIAPDAPFGILGRVLQLSHFTFYG